MKILPILLLFSGLFVLLHYFWIPALKRRIKIEKTLRSISLAGALSVITFLRNFFLIGSIVFLGVVLLIFPLSWLGTAGVGDIDQRIGLINELRERVRGIGEFVGLSLTAFLVLLVGFLVYRGATGAWKKRIEERVSEETERLLRDHNEGNWPEMKPTPEMLAIQQRANTLRAGLEDVVAKSGEIPPHCQEWFRELEAAWIQHDLFRRMDLTIDPAPIATSPRTWKEWFGTIFFSKGILTTLESGQKWIGRVGTALLFVCLIGIQRDNTIDALDNQVVRLDQLRIERSRKEAEDSRRQRINNRSSGQNSTVSEEDRRRANQLSRTFERTFAQAFHPLPASVRTRKEIQREVLRIDNRSRFDTTSGIESISAVATSANPEESLFSQAFEVTKRAGKHGEPATKVGIRFRDELLAEAAANTPLWRTIKHKTVVYAATFRESPDIYDAHSTLVGELIGQVIDLAPQTGDNEISKLAQKTATKFLKKAAEGAYDILSERFLTYLKTEPTVEDAAMETLATRFSTKEDLLAWRSSLEQLESTASITKWSRDKPPSFRMNWSHEIDFTGLEEAAKNLSASIPSKDKERLDIADAASDYDSWFPPHSESQDQTLRTAIEREVGTSGSSTAESSETLQAEFEKAHSYESLRGSPHVGGVLIGREADDGNSHLTGLSWKASSDKIQLVAHRGTAELPMGTFPKDLVLRALAYASDGRPCTVTMVYVQPINEIKVALHPALVDTQTGVDAIALDSFAFDFIEADQQANEWWRQAQDSVRNQNTVYSFARALRIEAANDYFRARKDQKDLSPKWDFLSDDPTSQKKSLASVMKEKRNATITKLTSPWGDRLELARKNLATKGEEGIDLLSKKTDFYDSDLVASIRKAVSESNNVTEFCQALYQETQSHCSNLDQETVNRWNLPAPSVDWVSGVRELSYSTDDELSFLKQNGSPAPFWPFEFVLQVGFSGQAGFVPDPVRYADKDPWILTDSCAKIAELFVRYLSKSPGKASAMSRMQQFAILQRFFRAGLNGKLGDDFPVERLVALTSSCAADDYVHTPRWVPQQGQLMAIEKATDSLVQIPADGILLELRNRAVNIFRSYIEKIKRDRSPSGSNRMQATEFEKSESALHQLETIDRGDDLSTFIKEIASVLEREASYRELRIALGVDSETTMVRSDTIRGDDQTDVSRSNR